jgi:putative ABC transport system substrate-binding protein
LGKKAAYAANQRFSEVPILYAQVENPERYGLTGFNVTGVSQEVSMDEVLSYLRLFAPEVERIGMLIWQKNQNQQVSEAIEAGKSAGYTVRALRVGNERDVPGAFMRLRRDIDAFWLVPDHLVVTPENFRFLRDETQRLEMPLIAYTDALVRAGALMGVGPDREAIGRQLASMAKSILDGTPVEDLPVQMPESVRVVLNRDTQNAIGLDIDPAMLGFVDEVLQVEGR